MTVSVRSAIAEILKREGTRCLIGYPANPIIEAAAEADIRTIIVRQERTGLHMADALSRLSSGERLGVFAMQFGPGTENAFGGVAQAYAESVPLVVLPSGYPRTLTGVPPNFSALLNFQHVTKTIEQVGVPGSVPAALRRAFTQAKNGRPRPTLVEIPSDLFAEDIPAPSDYRPSIRVRSAPDPADVSRAADLLVGARRPVIYAGQGVHYARAWDALRTLAEVLEAPVATSLEGKSAISEQHPLSLGAGGRAMPRTVRHFLDRADVIFGIGCSFATTNYGAKMPAGGPVYIHSTVDSSDLQKDLPVEHALVGDARLTLEALLEEIRSRISQPRDRLTDVVAEIASVREAWLAEWGPLLTSAEIPLSPYRVLWDLLHTVDVDNTIVTHDAGSPRDQLSPFWRTTTPLSYLGWGKSTQLGYGLGLALGAKLACPDKLCINVWGDAAIGMTGMDLETAVRERIPILSIVLKNSSMAIELRTMPVATERYRSTDLGGNYAEMMRAFGGQGERITRPEQIVPAIHRGIRSVQEGQPTLLEFITAQETRISSFA